jgi:hypothetical protein
VLYVFHLCFLAKLDVETAMSLLESYYGLFLTQNGNQSRPTGDVTERRLFFH